MQEKENHRRPAPPRIDREKRQRLARSVQLQYDIELPIIQRREEIAGLIRENQVIVVCGETGSGKSTQLPKICLELGRGIAGTIGHTQPRRIAARSIAARIADELQSPLGQAVGYKVRFDEKISPDSVIKLMTDGILLAESQSDKLFRQYDTLIIDEAHERSLNIDFLLGMLCRVLPQRPDLKLIITSATIDAKRFAEHFTAPRINRGKPVPIIEVSGRAYPIEILYRSLEEFDDEEAVSRETDLEERAILAAVDELAGHAAKSGTPGHGDMLIFLPTERDIFETAKALRSHPIPGDDAASGSRGRQTEILPLYARLPVKEQQKVFQISSRRKIVLATNVAESSLTVPGIRYVIDTGTARICRYSPRSRTQRLPIEAISRASADQRAGRCGRVGSGVCIRLFSEQDYRSRERYTTPEIQRTNLASVILQTKSLRLGEIEKFPFIDPPRIAAISDGYKTLYEIGALDEKRNLTPIGWSLSRLPVDPRIGRMILAAAENGVLREMLIIAAALEIQDPRERPQEHQGKADMAHAQYLDARSDFFGYLNLWDFYQNLKDKTSRSGLRKACQQHFLSFNRMKEWNDIFVQLQQFVHDAKMKIGPRKENFDALYEPLHRSILSGNLSGIAQRDNRFEYTAAGQSGGAGSKFVLWPGSGIQKSRSQKQPGKNPGRGRQEPETAEKPEGLPHWIVAAERVETTRRFLRTVAQIDAAWIEPMARHLIKRVYMEPHWNRETGYVHAYERVSLFGIVIVPKRRVNLGPIDPVTARDIFIQHALVDGDMDSNLEFFEYNETLLDEARKLQDKLRRPEIVRSETARYEFYQDRIPEDVYDRRSLERFVKSGGDRNDPDRSLFMTLSDLCTEEIPEAVLQSFPDRLETPEGGQVEIEYSFAPGEENDGLTVIVPKEGLRQLEPARLGWLVPGLVEQKIAALLKSLPKEIRRQIVPVPDTARELAKQVEFGRGGLEEQIARLVSRLIGRLVVPADFSPEQLPAELRMNIRVLDQDGSPLGEGRDLDELRKDFGVKAAETVAGADPRWNRIGLTDWDFGELPESIDLDRGGLRIKAFPMLFLQTVDDSVSCNLTLADSLDKAVRETRRAVTELFHGVARKDIRTQVQWLPQADRLRIYAQPLLEFDFGRDVARLMAARALQIEEWPLPRTAEQYTDRIEKAKARLGVAVQDVTKLIGPLLEAFHQARLAIEQNKSNRTEAAWRDAKEHLKRLVVPAFLLETPWGQLREFPRYFKAIPLRFEKLKSGGDSADRTATEELARYWEQYTDLLELHRGAGLTDPELEIFRWMLEEYRVSLFAQRLGTATKVSATRLDKQLEKVRR